MFEESEFSDGDNEPKHVSSSLPSRKRGRSSGSMLDASSSTSMTLHKPGSIQFQPFTTAEPMTKQEREKSILEWASAFCRCIRCEILRVSSKLSSLPPSTAIILLDLDNFGFHQFKRPEPRFACEPSQKPKSNSSDKHQKRTRLSHIASQDCFLWSFYGGGFEKHFGCEPCEGELVNPGVIDSGNVSGEVVPRVSIWSAFAGRSHFTRCGRSPDAVDSVLAAVLSGFGEMDRQVVVLTGDNHLAKFCAALAVPTAVVNVNEHERRVDRIWTALDILLSQKQ